MAQDQLTHNHDTAKKTLAKKINTGLKEYLNLNNSPHLNLADRDILEIVNKSSKEDIESFIEKLNTNDEFLPKMFLVTSPIIEQANQLPLRYKATEQLVLEDEEKTKRIILSGKRFAYKTQVQIIILAREEYTIQELSLLLLDVLNNMIETKYCLRLHDTENPNELYSVSNYGSMKIQEIQEAEFTQEDDENSGILASAIDFKVKQHYFFLKDIDDIAKKYELRPTLTVDDDSIEIDPIIKA